MSTQQNITTDCLYWRLIAFDPYASSHFHAEYEAIVSDFAMVALKEAV
jgi:hypothetical protein